MDNKIFITLGSQKFQFNRLLKAVDELCEKGTVDAEDVFAQIGYSDYLPKNFSYKKFLDRDEFSNEMEKANIVITHGGTGAIIGAVKKGKKVIAVPRRAKYGEHVDDHQLQLIKQFDDLNLICSILSFCPKRPVLIHQIADPLQQTPTLRYRLRGHLLLTWRSFLLIWFDRHPAQ